MNNSRNTDAHHPDSRDTDAGDTDAGDTDAGDTDAGDTVELQLTLPTAADTDDFGRRLGAVLRAGDLVILAGDLGAGKTALTKGIAVGMGVAGLVASPTFVIARVHRGSAGGPSLVHVDAYRLGGRVELDDLDLDTELSRAAVVVEWGTDVAEQLSESSLRIELTRRPDDTREAVLIGTGGDWADRLMQLAS